MRFLQWIIRERIFVLYWKLSFFFEFETWKYNFNDIRNKNDSFFVGMISWMNRSGTNFNFMFGNYRSFLILIQKQSTGMIFFGNMISEMNLSRTNFNFWLEIIVLFPDRNWKYNFSEIWNEWLHEWIILEQIFIIFSKFSIFFSFRFVYKRFEFFWKLFSFFIDSLTIRFVFEVISTSSIKYEKYSFIRTIQFISKLSPNHTSSLFAPSTAPCWRIRRY